MSLNAYLTRLILWCVLPVVMLVLFAGGGYIKTALDERDRSAAYLVGNFAAAVDQQLAARIGSLHLLASSPMVEQPARWKDLYQEAQGFWRSYGSHVFMADRDRHMLFNTRSPFGETLPPVPQPKGRAALPQAIVSGKAVVGDMVFGPVAKVPLVAIAVPAVSAGTAKYALLTTLETRLLQAQLERENLPSAWAMTLLDSNGDVLARRAPAGFDSARDVDVVGRHVVRLTQAPWSVALEIPRRSYYQPLFTMLAAFAAILLAVSLVSVLGGVRAGRRLSRQVAALTEEGGDRRTEPSIAEIAAVRAALDAVETERHSVEQILRDSQERLQLALEATSDGLWDWNIRSGSIYRSPRYYELVGRQPAPGCNNFEFFIGTVHPEDLPRVRAAIEAHREGRSPAIEFEYRLADCPVVEQRWLLVRGRAVERDADGKAVRMVGTLAGITERKRGEAARHLLSEAVEQSVLPMLMTDPETRITYVNPAFTKLLGYPLSALAGKPVSVLVPDGSRSVLEEAEIIHHLRDGFSWSAEAGRIAQNGEQIPVMVSVGAVRGEGGQLLGFVGNYLDLRPLREKDMALRKLALAVEQSPDSIIITNLAGEIEFVNDAFVRNTGFSRDEVLGRQPNIVRSGNTPRESYATLWSALRRGESWRGEFINRRKDGSEYVDAASVAPLRQPDGKITHYVAVQADITERKRNERIIREANERFSTIFEASPLGIALRRLVDGSFVDINPALEALSGYRRQDLLNPDERLSFWIDREAKLNVLEALRAGKAVGNVETRFRKQSGEIVDVAYVACPVVISGEAHFVEMVADITLQKAARQAILRDREQLEVLVAERTAELAAARDAADAANAAKSIFLANMSHEIRTPMNGVLGMANMLRRDGLSVEQSARVDKIIASGKHLLGIINDILDFSKIEAGKLVLEQRDFLLTELVRAILAVVGDSIRSKGLDFQIELGNLPQFLRGDPTRLAQALLNYLSNALKFTERGCITLRGRVEEENAAGYLLRFEVSDTGIGLNEEQQARIFTMFEQANSATTRKYGGTGLGLAITQRIAQHMGGTVGVRSRAGEGSSFWITVRLERGKRGEDEEITDNVESALLHEYSGRRVLLAEDDEVNQEVACLTLSDVGLTVDVAENGQQAIAMAGARSYDLILMDMQMPKVSGIDATRAIRCLPGYARTPILAMTANAFAEDKVCCLEAGMNDFISKPFDPEAFYAIVLKWLRRASALN